MSNNIHVFIDDSGDDGIHVNNGAAKIHCMAAVIFSCTEDMITTEKKIIEYRISLKKNKNYEFHFTEESHPRRMAFNEAVKDCPFIIRAMVIDKSRIDPSSKYIRSQGVFCRYVSQMVAEHCLNGLTDARVIIDGKIKPHLKDSLRKHLNKNKEERAIKYIRFKDSKSDTLIQLADMTVGSITKSYKTGDAGKGGHELRKIIRAKIDHIWEYK